MANTNRELILASEEERKRVGQLRVRIVAGRPTSVDPAIVWGPPDRDPPSAGTDGVTIGGRCYPRSTDAWGIDRQPLTDVITFGRTGDDALWLISRDHGVFKVR
jgi:hypothetical protein